MRLAEPNKLHRKSGFEQALSVYDPPGTQLSAWISRSENEIYRTVRTLARAEEEEIPTFVMLRRLLLMDWIGSHAETDLVRSLGGSYTD